MDGSAERLLEHSVWMKRLARTLVRDGDRAEELAQETWLRLLEHPPRLNEPVRGWIATVMRNLVRSARRGDARRAEREHDAGRVEAHGGSGLDLLERATLQRELVQAVLDLEEPYRTVILLRYFEERSPTAIAREQGIPVATVKTRLARGIARLRERLQRTRGPDGRASVLAGLALLEPLRAPLALPPALSWTLGALAVNTKLVVTIVLIVAVGVSYLWFSGDDAEPVRTAAAAPATPTVELATPPAPEPEVAEPFAPPASERVSAEVSSSSATTAEALPSPAAPRMLRGRVVDCEQRPVRDVAVTNARRGPGDERSAAAESTEVVARADADGRFEVPAGAGLGRLQVRDGTWTTVLAAMPRQPGSEAEMLLVVAPRISVGGVVVDEAGTPVEGALIQFGAPEDLRARLSLVLDFSTNLFWTAESDAQGKFRIEDLPAIENLAFQAHAEGFLPRSESVSPRGSTDDLVLVLERPSKGTSVLAGRVVDGAGAPVEGAHVSLAVDTAVTDAGGHFEFRLDAPDSRNREMRRHLPVVADRLIALKRGYLPGEVAAAREEGELVWPDPIVLVLGDEPLKLSGTVVGPDGEGQAGMRVWLVDPTFFGSMAAEGQPVRDFTHVESELAGLGAGWNWKETDGSGRFELEGLVPRDYTVAVMDPATLLRKEFPNVAAGRSDVVLRLPADMEYTTLAGRIVDGTGSPVANALVFPMCDAFRNHFQGRVIGTYHETTTATTTDGEGRFTLARVPRDLVYLRIEADDTIPLEWGREVEGGLASLVGDPQALEITVSRRCHFQVELAEPGEADELGMLDARGEVLVISEFLGNGRRDTERHPLREGRSATLAVGDSAAQLVLYRGGVEVRRIPVRLAPGEPTLLQP